MRHISTGKVRELYRLDDGRLLMVASDRISAFDYVLDNEIPDKGRILTAMSVWWFDQLADLVPSHLLSATDDAIPEQWRGRALLCAELEMVPVEAVARGYLAGSGLLDYERTGAVCGHSLPAGLRDGDRLPEPIFTPATKAALGEHDENVSQEAIAATVGESTAAELARLTLAIYSRAADIARARGIILADTKFEFGRRPGSPDLVLGDEVLTPDSSRFWPADRWEPGHAQPSYDKQYVRDWLLSAESGWDRASGGKPPALPDDIVAQTRARYVEAYELLTGLRFADWAA
ncbi:MAG TPA: phosphoribosylaminoimidazolesuccinocarboxamide synthase [Jatrophihabitantaceae bacterium]|jgi:phosphoribosylaminoimidazole-succinocarboxamide synthase